MSISSLQLSKYLKLHNSTRRVSLRELHQILSTKSSVCDTFQCLLFPQNGPGLRTKTKISQIYNTLKAFRTIVLTPKCTLE